MAADLVKNELRTGIWVRGGGSYDGFGEVYSGSTRVDLKANNGSEDCVDWTTTGTTLTGFPVAGGEWWGTFSDDCSPRLLYCFEP
jgi:hypothetical protein